MAINPSHDDIAKDIAKANGAVENPKHKWVWWLLPVLLFLSVISAFWGIRHIEKQVLAAAPSILREAGVDTADLRFQADYRDITVSGQLPRGVKSSELRELLEQNRGAAGEDIRRATIVAVEMPASRPPGDSTRGSGFDSAEPEQAQQPLQSVTSPRVNILLAQGELTMSGRHVSRPLVDRLLAAGSASVGLANVKQQWHIARLPGTRQSSDGLPRNIHQVDQLTSLVALLGVHATAASITLDDNRISGSIEASSERSVSLLRTRGGDGVVVTSAVDSGQLNSDRGDEESGVVVNGSMVSAMDNNSFVKDEVLRQEISALQIEIDALQLQLRDNVFFVHNSSAITREALPVLDKVGVAMRRYRRPSVQISGHTDSVSSRSYNLRLSKRRAAAVVQFLTQHGVDTKRLRSEGYGENEPIASNRTKSGRRLNRRVEFTARKPFDLNE